MPGTVTVDTGKTFSAMILIGASQRMKFGSESEPDITKQGEKKFSAEVAVTYLSENGMRPFSEVISVGIIGGELPTIPQGTAVEFDSLRAGLNPPERRENGKGISGGKLWWQGSGLRSATGSYRSPKSSEAVA